MENIDTFTMPNIQGKTVDQQIKLIYDHWYKVGLLAMKMNNEIIELKQKIANLENK